MTSSMISRHRLKISVSADELKSCPHGAKSRKTVENIISSACKQTGFAHSDSRLMIETVPSKEGGCTICVTRLPGQKYRYIGGSKGGRFLENEPYIFKFDSLDHCLAAGEEIMRHQEVLLSSLNLIFCKGKWYISFTPILSGLDGYRLDCLLGRLNEFGKEQTGGIFKEKSLMEKGVTVADTGSAESFFSLIDQSLSAPLNSEATASSTSFAPNT